MPPLEFDATESFRSHFSDELIRTHLGSGFEVGDWFRSGNQLPATAVQWWWDNGGAAVQRFIDWWRSGSLEVWVAPDGTPGVELPFEFGHLGVPLRGQIDLVAHSPDFSGLLVFDLKSGTVPDSARQLALYRVAIELLYDEPVTLGAYLSLRDKDGQILKVRDIGGPQSQYAYLAAEVKAVDAAINLGLFPARPGPECRRCPVAYACTEAGGDEAVNYDPNHPDYLPPF
jgi:putative RecB family exonuclease